MKTQQRKQKSEKKVDLELHFGEKPFVLFEADILAAEDFARIYRSRPLSPERELMVAVLEEALADYQRCFSARDKKARKRFAEAERWIEDTDSEWIFSFINCCEALAVEPGYLRQGLLRWKQGKWARPLSAQALQHQKNQSKRLRQAA
jgi:NDP-sugar pyrophosphorylase family protein